MAGPAFEQRANHLGALLGAMLGGVVGGALWWIIAKLTDRGFGLVAIVIGFAVGLGAAMLAGQRITIATRVIAGVVGILTYLAASYYVNRSIIMEFSNGAADIPVLPGPRIAWEVIGADWQPIDFAFVAIVAYTAFATVSRRTPRGAAPPPPATDPPPPPPPPSPPPA